MSSAQYGKMERLSSDPSNNSVYIIFRVFQLYDGGIDVKVYVNPPELQRQGLLRFSSDKYTVRALV